MTQKALVFSPQSLWAGSAPIGRFIRAASVQPRYQPYSSSVQTLEYLANAKAAGFMLGVGIRFALNSRADSTATQLTSCAKAIRMAHPHRPDVSHKVNA